MGKQLERGDRAPGFTLPVGDGNLTLSELHGQQVVLYFYPKSDTPGCTQESLDFNRLRGDFEGAGAVVVGISADSVHTQEKFRTKHDLAFTLASDTDHSVLEEYGVWAEKEMYGRRFMGIVRSTFLIGIDGRIREVWRNVRVPGHAEAVLSAARAAV